MDPLVAELTLAEVRAVQRRNRHRTGALRFPIAAIGVVTLLAAVWALAFGRDHVALFYAPAVAVTATAAAARYQKVARREGRHLSVAPWLATAAAVLALSAAVSQLGRATGVRWAELAGPTTVFAAGYLLLARWGSNKALGIAAILIIADSLIAPAFLDGDVCVAWQLAVSGALLVAAAAATRPMGTA
jgi:hypothetical protein